MGAMIYSPKGVPFIETTEIERLHKDHPDGIGIMIKDKTVLGYSKGYMDIDKFLDDLESIGQAVDLTNVDVGLHFKQDWFSDNLNIYTQPFIIGDTSNVQLMKDYVGKPIIMHTGFVNLYDENRQFVPDSLLLAEMVSNETPYQNVKMKSTLEKYISNDIDNVLIFNYTGIIQMGKWFKDYLGNLYTSPMHEGAKITAVLSEDEKEKLPEAIKLVSTKFCVYANLGDLEYEKKGSRLVQNGTEIGSIDSVCINSEWVEFKGEETLKNI